MSFRAIRSAKQPASNKQNSGRVLFAALLLGALTNALTEILKKRYELQVHVSLCLFFLNLVLFAVSIRVAGIEFGPPDLVWEQHAAGMIKGLVVIVWEVLLLLKFEDNPPQILRTGAMVLNTAVVITTRGSGVQALGLCMMALAALRFPSDSPEDQGNAILKMSMGLIETLGGCTKYLKDQRLLLFLGFLQCIVPHVFVFSIKGRRLISIVTWCVAGPLMFYAMELFRRRHRRLPSALDGIKFVRFGFVRRRSGNKIRRYQEMPFGAFGNVEKAMRLIIVSHRWLSRTACDLATSECPEGLRLETMRKVLNKHWSPTSHDCSLVRRLLKAFFSIPVGGWDAVIFFDFMGLPQVPRSDAEELLFRKCLPSMGVLYSMFPTLVLAEVTPEVHGYLVSGWCYCELTTAHLGKQLSQYSLEAVAKLGLGEGSAAGAVTSDNATTWSDADAENFLNTFENDLKQKAFFIPADATAVRVIIQAYVLKRLVLDAIQDMDNDRLRSVISRLQEQEILQTTLDQPVNASLDTALHMAVRMKNLSATQILLENGANPRQQNLYGDMPFEWLIIPRCSSAARACSLHRSTVVNKLSEGIDEKSSTDVTVDAAKVDATEVDATEVDATNVEATEFDVAKADAAGAPSSKESSIPISSV